MQAAIRAIAEIQMVCFILSAILPKSAADCKSTIRSEAAAMM